MPKAAVATYQSTSLLFTPVDNRIKNVYSLRTQTGTNSDHLPTPSLLTNQLSSSAVHKYRVTPLFVLAVTAQFYTQKNSYFNLLTSRLYPQSTAPINKKKKERLERNT